ncbi:hypothetical protein [Breoghania sp.]|uniref:hypothetical protein n=1 Tax=Breoghania sp. TaxID=2065378 RepID=UPI002AAAFC03|nr:hypothetical protein [Breoghania sp.]
MPIGITFKETMAGAFALGEASPQAGEERGKAQGLTLAIHARVEIPDLDAFIADPDHCGKLSGTVDFSPLGIGLTASQGVFNLFQPSDDPKLKYMVYELGFSHDGHPLYLAGKKHVRDDAGFDMWSDTTTLLTHLHEGENAQGGVIGAGVLRLNGGALASLMSTIRVIGTDNPLEQAGAVAKFGQFFMGELWDSYAPRFGQRENAD